MAAGLRKNWPGLPVAVGFAQILIGLVAIVIAATAIKIAEESGAESTALLRAIRGAPTTEIVVYSPPRIEASDVTITAMCLTGGGASTRADAARCFTNSGPLTSRRILDPCFASPFPLVPGDPVIYTCPQRKGGVTSVIAIELTPFDADAQFDDDVLDSPALTRPWKLRLPSGEECYFTLGASDVTAESRLNYICGDPFNPSGWILGLPDSADDVWTAYYSPRPEGLGGPFRPVNIRRATI